jgi:hypothetical protein
LPGDLHIGLVDPPAISRGVPAGADGVGQQRREALHPAVHRDVVDLDAALSQKFLYIAIGQPEAQIPADRQHDDVGWEAEAGEGRPWDRSKARSSSHAGSLTSQAPLRERNSAVPSCTGSFGHLGWKSELVAA